MASGMDSAGARKTALPRWLPHGVWLLALFAQFLYLPDIDTTWLMTVGSRLLDGARLYSSDIVEVNTPPIMQIMQGVMWVSQRLHLDPVIAWRIIVAAFVAASMLLLSRAFRLTLPTRAADLHLPVLGVVAALATCLPGADTGQREHLVVLGLVPYVFWSAERAIGGDGHRLDRVLAGVLMGFAIWLKPPHLLTVLFVEGGVLFFRPTLRVLRSPEFLAGAVTAGVYGLYVLVWVPEYFTFAVPLALQFYPAYGALHLRWPHLMYIAVPTALVCLVTTPRIAVVQSYLCLAAGLGAFLAFAAQDKGFRYQFLPARVFLLAAAGIAFAALLRVLVSRIVEIRGPSVRRLSAITASLTLLLFAGGSLVRALSEARTDRVSQTVVRLVEEVRRVRANDAGRPFTLLVLSVDPYPAFPLTALTGARWGSRFSCLWMLPAILEDESRPRQPGRWAIDGRRYLVDAVVADFRKWPPDVVVVKRTGPYLVIDELLKDDRFRALWAPFRSQGRRDGFEIFTHPAPALASGSST